MRTAVLGVGRMGRRHVQVAAKAGCELVGAFDVKAESLTLAQQEANLPAGVLYTDLDRLYTDAKPELVIISTTADSHAALTAQAAERGAKFILVEKPMAQSLADCDRMIEVCRAHGVRLAVNHQMRFMEQYTHPRALGYSEAFGGIQSMTVVGGNFGMANNGTHYFEAFRYMMGEDVASVSAWFSPEIVPNPRGPQFMDRAGSLRAVTTGGKRFYMDVSADQGHGVLVTYACRYGTITVNELMGEMIAISRQDEHRALPTTRYGMPATVERVQIAPAEVIDTSVAVLQSLLTGTNEVSGEVGRRSVEVLVAAYRSAAKDGAPVAIAGDLGRDEAFPWA